MSNIVLTPIGDTEQVTGTVGKSVFRVVFTENGEPLDPTSVVLCDAGATYGVKRLDLGAVVVAANTPMVCTEPGRYQYELTDPAPGLWYEAVVTAMIRGQVYRVTLRKQGGGGNLRELSAALDPLIVPYLPGAPLAVVHQVERRILRDWCRQGRAWKQVVNAVTVAGQAEYELSLPAGTHVLDFVEARIDDAAWTVLKLAPDQETVEFSYAPAESDLVIEVTVILGALMSCEFVPEWIVERYGDGLAAGVLAYMHGMAGMPWYRPNSVGIEMDQFRSCIGEARVERLTSRGPAVTYLIGGMAI